MAAFAPTGTLDDLVPDARRHVEELLAAAAAAGMQPRVVSVGRSCQQQADIYAGGGATHANLCRSWHVMGRAVDLRLEPDACETYTRLGEVWEGMGGIWGGRWTGQFGACGDRFHYEWAETAAVPTSLCPSDVTLEECEALREQYLAEAFGVEAQAEPERAGIGWWLLALGAVALGIWVRRR